MQLVLDLALIGLLGATLFHALRLERALGVLKRDRAALEELVASFNSSTRLAEQGIERLRTTADGAGRQISRQIERAAGLKDDLVFLCERGERLADRLEIQVRAGRTIAPEPSFEAPSPFLLTASREPVRDERSLAQVGAEPVAINLNAATAGGEEPYPRLRSQAERDLLKALRMPR
jgi:hypothetical protein